MSLDAELKGTWLFCFCESMDAGLGTPDLPTPQLAVRGEGESLPMSIPQDPQQENVLRSHALSSSQL